jgi:hypothetical protein
LQKLKQIYERLLMGQLGHSGMGLETLAVIPGRAARVRNPHLPPGVRIPDLRRTESRPRRLSTAQRFPYRTPVPLQRWHFTTWSPFLTRPLPSQFLHFCFFLMFGPLSLAMPIPFIIERIIAVMRHILRQTTAKMI